MYADNGLRFLWRRTFIVGASQYLSCYTFSKGTTIITETVDTIEAGTTPFRLHTENGTVVEADTVVIATGAVARKLEFPGAEEFWQKGISVRRLPLSLKRDTREFLMSLNVLTCEQHAPRKKEMYE